MRFAKDRRKMAEKKRRNLLPPQSCPQCGADLSDPSVPREYRAYRELFGLAIEIDDLDGKTQWWCCPECRHMWAQHQKALE